MKKGTKPNQSSTSKRKNPQSKRNRNRKREKRDQTGGRYTATNLPGIVPKLNNAVVNASFNPTSTLINHRPGSTPGGTVVTGRELFTALKKNDDVGPLQWLHYQTRWYASPTWITPIDGNYNTYCAIHPSNLPRLSFEAATYEYFRWRKLKLFFTPVQPTTAQGITFIGVDYQGTDHFDVAGYDEAQIMANIASVATPIYSIAALDCPSDLQRIEKYSTDAPEATWLASSNRAEYEQCTPAVLRTIMVSSGLPGGSLIFYVSVEYEVEFFGPQLQHGNTGLVKELALLTNRQKTGQPLPNELKEAINKLVSAVHESETPEKADSSDDESTSLQGKATPESVVRKVVPVDARVEPSKGSSKKH